MMYPVPDVNGHGSFVTKAQLLLAVLFPLFTIFALGIDSVAFSEHYFDGRFIADALGISYFMLMYYFAGSRLRLLMLVMVPLSYIGELIFCKLLGMYSYRTPAIPLYVPFGHAIVYASGYIFAYTDYALRNRLLFRKIFMAGFALLFAGVALVLHDIFSLFSGMLFFLLLWRKKWQVVYFFIALCVIYIELVGTFFRCWAWQPDIFGSIPTANPPMGAVFYYAGGDVLLAKIADIWCRRKTHGIV